MTEGEFVDHILALGFVVLDDAQGYKICRQYNPDIWLAALPRQQLQYLSQKDVDQLIALGLSAEATAM